MEIWKPVPSYEDRYEVSSFGRVRSLPILVEKPGRRSFIHPLSNRILRQTTTPRGYKQVMLHTGENSERKTSRVHRLVCEAFHGPAPEGKEHVLHGDGNPSNNTPTNLRWGTHDENIKEAVAHGSIRSGERHPKARLSDSEVAAIRAMRSDGASYRKIAEKFKIHWCYVQKIALYKVRSA